MEYKPTIKEWDDADRPREKLLAKGRQALSEAELIAILIGSGNRDESAVDLSRRVLKSVENNLVELSRMSVNDLMKFKGIGEAKAISIVAALELGRRRRGAEVLNRKKISSSKDVFELLQLYMSDSAYEEFWVLFLSRSNSIIKHVKVSDGGVSGTVADPKRIFREAIESACSSMILCHNHPSGNIQASDADKQLTRKIVSGAAYFDIKVLDHIIIGGTSYFSFADSGIMPG